MTFGGKSNDLSIKVGNKTITKSTEEKILGVSLDKQLSRIIKRHTYNRYAGQKLHDLSPISYLLGTEKLKHRMLAFIVPQFSSATAPLCRCLRPTF